MEFPCGSHGQILTCERNALRYESTEAAKPGKVAPALREGGDKVGRRAGE